MGELVIAGTPEAAEDLAANGIIPVTERIADGPGPRCPRSAAQHLVLAAEEHFRVFGIRKRLISRIADEIARRPLPHVADHSVAADRRPVVPIRAGCGNTE